MPTKKSPNQKPLHKKTNDDKTAPKKLTALTKCIHQIEQKLEEFFHQTPHLHEKCQNWFVKYLPWFVGVAIVLIIFLLIPLLGFAGLLFKMFSFKLVLPVLIGIPMMLLNLYLCVTAYTPLKEKKIKGWNNMFYMQILRAVYTVATVFTTTMSGFAWSLVQIIVSLYILFQIKNHYK